MLKRCIGHVKRKLDPPEGLSPPARGTGRRRAGIPECGSLLPSRSGEPSRTSLVEWDPQSAVSSFCSRIRAKLRKFGVHQIALARVPIADRVREAIGWRSVCTYQAPCLSFLWCSRGFNDSMERRSWPFSTALDVELRRVRIGVRSPPATRCSEEATHLSALGPRSTDRSEVSGSLIGTREERAVPRRPCRSDFGPGPGRPRCRTRRTPPRTQPISNSRVRPAPVTTRA
jgi:hypothetical protein